MLVLSRKPNESIVIAGNIRITVASIRGRYVRLGIEAPRDVEIYREELTKGDEADASVETAYASSTHEHAAQSSIGRPQSRFIRRERREHVVAGSERV